MIQYLPQAARPQLSQSYIYLDTGVFIFAGKNKDFFDYLTSLKQQGSTLLTIPQVVFEFTRNSNTLEQYNNRIDLVNKLADTVVEVKFLDKIVDFDVVMAKINDQNKSHTDFLLAACLYNLRQHKNVFLISADLRAYPNFFNREQVITVLHKNEVKNFVVYKFNTKAYAKAAASILDSDSIIWI